MAIRNCRILALEGSHGTGKSTLAHALASHYKSRHVHAATLAETARTSPFVEEVVIHKAGPFDLSAELQLFGSQIAQEALLARHHELLICDKTIANVIGYARLLLGERLDAFGKGLLAAMETFCRAYCQQYDAVFYLSDFYDLGVTPDPFRPRDPSFRREADVSIRNSCVAVGMSPIDVPACLSTDEKISVIASAFPPFRSG